MNFLNYIKFKCCFIIIIISESSIFRSLHFFLFEFNISRSRLGIICVIVFVLIKQGMIFQLLEVDYLTKIAGNRSKRHPHIIL